MHLSEEPHSTDSSTDQNTSQNNDRDTSQSLASQLSNSKSYLEVKKNGGVGVKGLGSIKSFFDKKSSSKPSNIVSNEKDKIIINTGQQTSSSTVNMRDKSNPSLGFFARKMLEKDLQENKNAVITDVEVLQNTLKLNSNSLRVEVDDKYLCESSTKFSDKDDVQIDNEKSSSESQNYTFDTEKSVDDKIQVSMNSKSPLKHTSTHQELNSNLNIPSPNLCDETEIFPGVSRLPVDATDMMKCEKCGELVSMFEMPEHNDFHFAMELQQEFKPVVSSHSSGGSESSLKRKSDSSGKTGKGGGKKKKIGKDKSIQPLKLTAFFSKS